MKDEILCIGGLDKDTNRNLVKSGNYLDARNLTVSISNKGAKENQKSTRLVTYTLPSGTNTRIGSTSGNGTVIYFIKNTLGNHSILEFTSATETILPILAPINNFTTNFLDFDSLIHSADLFDGNLTWTDNDNPPRHLEVARAKAFMTGATPTQTVFPYDSLLATGTTAQKEQFISAIKYPPTSPPTLAYATNSSAKTNYIRGHIWQFCYRYVYSDRSRSVFSTFSKVSTPADEEFASTVQYANNSLNNQIQVTLNTGHPNVVRIEVAVRDGNLGQWNSIEKPIYKYNQDNTRILNDFANYVFTFDGSANQIVLADAEVIPPFHTLPRLAESQKYLYNDHLVYGNILQGFDNTRLDVGFDYVFTEKAFALGSVRSFYSEVSPQSNMTGWGFSLAQVNTSTSCHDIIIPSSPAMIAVGALIIISVQVDTTSSFASTNMQSSVIVYEVKANDLLNWPTNLGNSLVTTLNNSPSRVDPTGANTWTAMNGSFAFSGLPTVELALFPGSLYTFYKFFDLQVINPTDKYSTWKKGATHKFGIEYLDDAGRFDTVNEAGEIYIPTLSQIKSGESLFLKNYTVGIYITIRNLPPSWATKYRIIWGGRSIGRSVTVVADSFPQSYIFPNNYKPGVVAMKIARSMDYMDNPNINGLTYAWEPGDRLRIITDTAMTVDSTIMDVAIHGYDAANQVLICDPFDAASTIRRVGAQFEIYNQSQPVTLYREIGETFDVTGGYHMGNYQNQTSGQAAINLLTDGDCWLLQRSYYVFKNNIYNSTSYNPGVWTQTASGFIAIPYDISCESDNFSDFYQSTSNNIGRLNVVDPHAAQMRFENKIVHGGRYRTGGNVSSVFNFDPTDEFNVDISFGAITKLEQTGFVLKVLQERKLSSIYIQRYYLQGSSSPVFTQTFFNDYRPSAEAWGCVNPESVVSNQRHLYYYDGLNGKVIRDSANGQVPISDYLVSMVFYAFSKMTNQVVFMGYDTNKEMLYVTYTSDSISDTITFNDTTNEWISLHDMLPEGYEAVGNKLLAFDAGSVNIIEGGTDYLSIFGVAKEASITFIANRNMMIVSVYDNIAVKANKVWNAGTFGDINIQPSELYPIGMESRLLENHFRWKEGISFAAFIRDANTPNFATRELAVVEGRNLRGNNIAVKLRNSHTERTEIRGITITQTESKQ